MGPAGRRGSALGPPIRRGLLLAPHGMEESSSIPIPTSALRDIEIHPCSIADRARLTPASLTPVFPVYVKSDLTLPHHIESFANSARKFHISPGRRSSPDTLITTKFREYLPWVVVGHLR